MAEVDARPVTLDQSAVGRVSRIDAIQQQQMAVARRRRVEQQGQQIRAALARLAAGTYGACLRCEEPIGLARLQVRPEGPLCLDCQAAVGA